MMEDLKRSTNKRNLKENKYIMEAGKLKIGKGVISYDENILIPLNAISLVEIPEPEEPEQGIHELKIQNHAGTCFYITSLDLDFIREIRSALMICIHNRNAVYSAMERAVKIEKSIIYRDKITIAGDIHIDKPKYSHASGSEKRNTRDTRLVPILDDEWISLKDYSLKRMKDFPVKDRNHTICKAMAVSAALKNREKCKKILEVSGNDSLDIIIVGAPISIKAIINKLM